MVFAPALARILNDFVLGYLCVCTVSTPPVGPTHTHKTAISIWGSYKLRANHIHPSGKIRI